MQLATLSVDQNIGEALGEQHGGAGSTLGHNGIGGARGAIDEDVGLREQLAQVATELARGIRNRVLHPHKITLGVRQRFADGEDAAGIGDHGISKRATGIDSNAISHAQLHRKWRNHQRRAETMTEQPTNRPPSREPARACRNPRADRALR